MNTATVSYLLREYVYAYVVLSVLERDEGGVSFYCVLFFENYGSRVFLRECVFLLRVERLFAVVVPVLKKSEQNVTLNLRYEFILCARRRNV